MDGDANTEDLGPSEVNTTKVVQRCHSPCARENARVPASCPRSLFRVLCRSLRLPASPILPPLMCARGRDLRARLSVSAAASAHPGDSRQASHLVKVHKDKLTVTYNGKANHNHDVGAVQSNRAFSHSVLIGYFEMTIVNQVCACAW